jgi:tetratricopeptide (TPR) repeat protein
MSPLYEHLIAQAQVGRMLATREVSRFSPAQIREAIALLVEQDRLPLAAALSDAGLSLYPSSEDVLSICGLLCAVRGDWVQAETRLRELLEVQGASASAFNWRLLVRSLRCQLEHQRAFETVQQALALHPTDSELLAELASLREWRAGGAGHAAVSTVQ